MKNYDEIIGERYGKLKIEKFLYKNDKHVPIVQYKCDCGNTYVGNYYRLRRGYTKSCGCYRSEYVSSKNKKHGLSKCEIYPIWKSIKQRCYNDKCKDFKYYGNVGITMCDTWKESFVNFYNDMYSDYKAHCRIYGRHNTSLDRINPNGNYSKDNCMWSTWKEQNNFSHKRIFKENTEVND